MDAASGGPDDLRTLAQAVADGRDWSRGRLVQALGVVTTCPEDVDALARAILNASDAERDAADARGYARAMGEVEAHADREAAAFGTGRTSDHYARAMDDTARWARERAAAAERD